MGSHSRKVYVGIDVHRQEHKVAIRNNASDFEQLDTAIIGVIKDINMWPNKKKFKKALGVYSNLKQSGTAPGKWRQGKEGSRHARRALFQVCFRCIPSNAPDNDFKDHCLRQVARGKPRVKALVSTMGKLAEIIYYCLKTGEFYRYQGKYSSLGSVDSSS